MDLNTVTELAPAPGATWRGGDAWLAGGTWLFSEPQPDVCRLLDLNDFDWPPLAPSPDGLQIAATCTLAQLLAWTPPPEWTAWPLVRNCCDALLASFKVWNTATVGGNLCLSLPAGSMTSLVASLDGVCTIWTPGAPREVAAVDFVTGVCTNVLAPGELLRSITVPVDALRSRVAFRRIALSTYGRSAALVIGRRSPAGELVVTVTASTPRPVQLRFPAPPPLDTALAALDVAVPGYHDDVHGAPAWRAAMTRRLVAEVIDELAG